MSTDMTAIERYFMANGLTFTDEISLRLQRLGMKCVEHLRFLEDSEWEGLFARATVIEKRVAAHVPVGLCRLGRRYPER
jgi:hypothetical protein